MTPVSQKAGFNVVDPGRFDLPANNFTPEIELQIGRRRDRPRRHSRTRFHHLLESVRRSRASSRKSSPPARSANSRRASIPTATARSISSIEVWWSKFHPYSSEPHRAIFDGTRRGLREGGQPAGLDGPRLPPFAPGSCRRRAENDAEARRSGIDPRRVARQRLQVDRRARQLQDRAVAQHAARRRCVGGQWRKGKKWPLELAIVDNKLVAEHSRCNGQPEPMTYRLNAGASRRGETGWRCSNSRRCRAPLAGSTVIDRLDLQGRGAARSSAFSGRTAPARRTLFNMIAGVLPPSGGRILFEGARHHGDEAVGPLPARHRPHLSGPKALHPYERVRERAGRRPCMAATCRWRVPRAKPKRCWQRVGLAHRALTLPAGQLALLDMKQLELAKALAAAAAAAAARRNRRRPDRGRMRDPARHDPRGPSRRRHRSSGSSMSSRRCGGW